jgi:EamA domain-containing membrane protein RarD
MLLFLFAISTRDVLSKISVGYWVRPVVFMMDGPDSSY